MLVLSRLLSLTLIAILLIACGEEKTSESVFPRTSPACEPSALKGRYIVSWEDGSTTLETASSRQDLIDKLIEPNLQAIRHVEVDRMLTGLSQGIYQFRREADPHESFLPNDSWGLTAVQADWAWRLDIRGQGTTVAIIDSLVDIEHPQLASRIAFNPGETGLDDQGRDKRTNQIDDDGNGYIDDYAGYNFFSHTPNKATAPDIHGTHVAGIIAAEHMDTEVKVIDYAQGLAPKSRILPLAFIGSLGGGSLYDAIRAIDYAVMQEVDIINASWGGAACSPELARKIKDLESHNILFVAASGNRGIDIDRWPEYPASFNLANQITVGSIGRSGLMADHSNFGDQNVHLFAPGVDIFSTVPFGGHESLTGTSMAAPFVSGALALLKGHRPQATASQLRQVLLQSVDQRDLYRNASRGRLNVARALMEIENLVAD